MRVFYVFNINNGAYQLFNKNSYYLYNILNEIRSMDKKYACYANNLFFSICKSFDKDKLNMKIFIDNHNVYQYSKTNNTHIYNDLYLGEESTMIINKLFIKIQTNKDNNYFFKILNNDYMFAIDFYNEDFFFLNDIKALL